MNQKKQKPKDGSFASDSRSRKNPHKDMYKNKKMIQARFERTTYSLGGSRSILLSYWTIGSILLFPEFCCNSKACKSVWIFICYTPIVTFPPSLKINYMKKFVTSALVAAFIIFFVCPVFARGNREESAVIQKTQGTGEKSTARKTKTIPRDENYTIRIYSNSNSKKQTDWLISKARDAGFRISIDSSELISGDTSAVKAANENSDGDVLFGLNDILWSQITDGEYENLKLTAFVPTWEESSGERKIDGKAYGLLLQNLIMAYRKGALRAQIEEIEPLEKDSDNKIPSSGDKTLFAARGETKDTARALENPGIDPRDAENGGTGGTEEKNSGIEASGGPQEKLAASADVGVPGNGYIAAGSAGELYTGADGGVPGVKTYASADVGVPGVKTSGTNTPGDTTEFDTSAADATAIAASSSRRSRVFLEHWSDLTDLSVRWYRPGKLDGTTNANIVYSILFRFIDPSSKAGGISTEGWKQLWKYFSDGVFTDTPYGLEPLVRGDVDAAPVPSSALHGITGTDSTSASDLEIADIGDGAFYIAEYIGIIEKPGRTVQETEQVKAFVDWFGSTETRVAWTIEFGGLPCDEKARRDAYPNGVPAFFMADDMSARIVPGTDMTYRSYITAHYREWKNIMENLGFLRSNTHENRVSFTTDTQSGAYNQSPGMPGLSETSGEPSWDNLYWPTLIRKH